MRMETNMKYDILSIQERAVKRRKEGHFVLNGCAGMLFEEDKSLCTFESVNQTIQERFSSYLAYPSVLGSKEYEEGVLQWLFPLEKERIAHRYSIAFSASLGGTGALYLAFKHFAQEKAHLLLSDIRWPNYDTLAKEAGIGFSLYSLFNEDERLNIKDIKAKIDESLLSNGSVLVVINDPCQNPLGYCMDEQEYRELFQLLEGYRRKVALLLDIAYVDYHLGTFPLWEILCEKTWDFDLFFAFSASKSFGLYGLRLGALFAFLEKGKSHAELLEDLKAIARGTYSCVNNGAMGPMAEFFHNAPALYVTREKIQMESQRLLKMGERLERLLDRKGIHHFPYKGGFYLTFEVDDALSFCQELERKDIYFAPIDGRRIRIAVSGLSVAELEELERRLS